MSSYITTILLFTFTTIVGDSAGTQSFQEALRMTDQNQEEGTSQAGPNILVCPREWGAHAPQVHGASSCPALSPPGTGPPSGCLPPVGSRSLTGDTDSCHCRGQQWEQEVQVGLRMTGAKQHPSHEQLMEARTHVTFKDADLRTDPEPIPPGRI